VTALTGHEVIACARADLDVGDDDACRRTILAARPEVVIHAAAYTDVDGCELHPERAWRDNVLGSRNVARAAHEAGAFLIAISSDYVFDGGASEPYDEDAPVAPLGAYGRSKAAGEGVALEANPDATAIVRSSWIYGRVGKNFVKTMLGLAAEREVVEVVDDQTGSPTCSADLARALVWLASARRAGTYHVTSAGSTTWFGFAREIFAAVGYDPERVRPTTTAALGRPARRPAYSVLGDRSWRLAGLPPLPHWRDALRVALPEILAEVSGRRSPRATRPAGDRPRAD
jgi:dTDP-4-dehydrorhamnose reductase